MSSETRAMRSARLDRAGRVLLMLVGLITALAVAPALLFGLLGLLQVNTDPSAVSLLCWGGSCQDRGWSNVAASTLVIVSAIVIIVVRKSGSASPVAGALAASVIAGSVIAAVSLGLVLLSEPRINLAVAALYGVAFGFALALGASFRLMAQRRAQGGR